MEYLREHIVRVPDFPKPGVLFRDITPLLLNRFSACIETLDDCFSGPEWDRIEVIAGIESRGFILAAGLAQLRSKGFLPIRKQGKLPPPVVPISYELEYGTGILEAQRGAGNVLVVDDVLATGGTMQAAADLCELAGYSVVGLAVLLDLKLIAPLRWKELTVRVGLCDE